MGKLEEWKGEVRARNERLAADLRALEGGTETVRQLEDLWHALKFVVLEGDPAAYFKIREAFNRYRQGALEWEALKGQVFGWFYGALTAELQESNLVNVLTHIWGYLRRRLPEGEPRQRALAMIARVSDGQLEQAPETYAYFAELHEWIGKPYLMEPDLKCLVRM